MAYGRTVIGSIGEEISLVAGGLSNNARWKVGGITIDWSTVTALAAPYTEGSGGGSGFGTVYPVGAKVLRYGQVMCLITATGLYGPYDPTAADGRQLLLKGKCYILNTTVSQFAPFGVTTMNNDNVGVLAGGTIWLERVVQSGVAAHSLALGPTLVEFEAAFGALIYAV